MSEKNMNKAMDKNATKEEKKNDTKKKDDVVVSKEPARVLKMEWTLDRCKKYARKFSSEILWASGSPASYKSALAHGWKDLCLAEMEIARGAGNVPRNVAAKKAA